MQQDCPHALQQRSDTTQKRRNKNDWRLAMAMNTGQLKIGSTSSSAMRRHLRATEGSVNSEFVVQMALVSTASTQSIGGSSLHLGMCLHASVAADRAGVSSMRVSSSGRCCVTCSR